MSSTDRQSSPHLPAAASLDGESIGAPIAEIDARGLTTEQFHNKHVRSGKPLVLRGAVSDWPVAQAGRDSPEALARYLLQFDRGQLARAMVAPTAARGRFFYNEAVTGFNFRTESLSLGSALDLLLNNLNDPHPIALAIQSLQLWSALPGFDRENSLALLPASVEPRAWLGNRAVVAAHYDPSENIACVAAGTRRFTLFPPDQVENLYPGPFELTPAGPTISMVDFDQPDLAAYPRFTEAMRHAQTAELAPGDAIYIPYLWWHHVRSTEPLNLLINYWWAPPARTAGHPVEALIHAMAAIRGLPPHARDAWQAMFANYVFSDSQSAAHLPEAQRGIQAEHPAPESFAWAHELLAARYRS
jgi:hypothetical protein